MKFLFDLDGTLTQKETLPIIASLCNKEEQINDLTRQTIQGNVPFVESFIKRVNILGSHSYKDIQNTLEKVELFERVCEFIRENKDDCIVVTGNLDVWVEKIIARIGCSFISSQAVVTDGKVQKINTIVRKEEVVRELQRKGHEVIFIGDGNNDAEAMRCADVSIASGLIHEPAMSVMSVANYAVYSEKALVRILNQINKPNDSEKTIVLSCAGIGSRLGIGTTKALLKFEGLTLIQYHLNNFKEVDDVRVVVGYQYNEVICSALKTRKDIIFVFNHEYYCTGTGKSLFLGSRFANNWVYAWDGDLIVHPEDIERCITTQQEYIAYSSDITDDAVFVEVINRSVTSFTRCENTGYEWSGPACIMRDNIHETDGHVYELLEARLPIESFQIKAFDIDTDSDYKKAKEFFINHIHVK